MHGVCNAQIMGLKLQAHHKHNMAQTIKPYSILELAMWPNSCQPDICGQPNLAAHVPAVREVLQFMSVIDSHCAPCGFAVIHGHPPYEFLKRSNLAMNNIWKLPEDGEA